MKLGNNLHVCRVFRVIGAHNPQRYIKVAGATTISCNKFICSFILIRKYTGIVMALDNPKKYIQIIRKHLTDFESKPKIIEGNMIREWFNVGENIFYDLYNLGTSSNWNPSEIKKQPETCIIVSRVTENKDWLQSFITIYPGLRIDLEGATPAVDVCRVRSGIELLLQGFAGINQNFDKVLKDLKEFGELEEFDDHLKVWKESYRPDFFPGDRHPSIPKSHWWWF